MANTFAGCTTIFATWRGMNMALRCFISMAVLLVEICAVEARGQGFFTPAKDAAAALPADQVYPRGRIFPYGFFDASSGGITLEQYKADGFTLIGPYGDNNVLRANAKKAGLSYTATIGQDDGSIYPWNIFTEDPPPTFDPADISRRVAEQVALLADDPTICWWYLVPEELRFWRENEMLYLKTVSNAIRKNDPLKRPIWMYEQNHRTADALANLLPYIDVIGKGAYTNYSRQRESRVWVRWTMEQQVRAIAKSGRAGDFPILVPEMFEQPPAGTESLVPAWARHDVYLGLVCGAKGIVVYAMSHRTGFEVHDAYYGAYRQVAGELAGPTGLGQVFLFGEKRKDIRIDVIDGPKILVQKDDFGAELGKDVEYPSIAWFDAAYGEARYLIAVNSANEPVKAKVSGLPAVKVNMTNLFDATDRQTRNTSEFEASFAPLGVKGWRITVGGQS